MNLYNPCNQKLVDLTAKVEKYRTLCSLAKSYVTQLEIKNDTLYNLKATEEELLGICYDEEECSAIRNRIDLYYEDDGYDDYEMSIAEDLLTKYEQLLEPVEKEYLHERTEELRKRIFTVTAYNSKKSALFDDTKTLKIISDFYEQDIDFLLLSVPTYRIPFTYVIVKAVEDVEHYSLSPSITDLKKGESVLLNDITKCVRAVEQEFMSNKRKRVFPFDKPCPLRAQTFDDRTGYHGKQYGETKDFLIIGVSF